MAGSPGAFQDPFGGLRGKTAKDWGFLGSEASKYDYSGNAAYTVDAYKGKHEAITERRAGNWGMENQAVSKEGYQKRYKSDYLGQAKAITKEGDLAWEFRDFTNRSGDDNAFHLVEEDARKWQTHTQKIDSLLETMGYNPHSVTHKIKSPFSPGKFMTFTSRAGEVATDETFVDLLKTGGYGFTGKTNIAGSRHHDQQKHLAHDLIKAGVYDIEENISDDNMSLHFDKRNLTNYNFTINEEKLAAFRETRGGGSLSYEGEKNPNAPAPQPEPSPGVQPPAPMPAAPVSDGLGGMSDKQRREQQRLDQLRDQRDVRGAMAQRGGGGLGGGFRSKSLIGG